jgi:hypothetical protein
VSGRHRPAGAPARRSLRTPLAVLGVAGLVALTAVAVQTVAADADGCSTGGVRLGVAADPAIAPALRDIAAQWTKTNPQVNGGCVRVEITERASADVASALGVRAGGSVDVAADPAPTPSESDIPAVWIPDSVFWLTRVQGVDRNAFDVDAPSIAASPVVLGVSEADAAKLGDGGGPTGLSPETLGTLLKQPDAGAPPLRLGIAEPRRDSASLVGALILHEALVKKQSDLKNLVGAFRQIGGPAPDTPSLLKAFGQGINAAPMSEQTVVRYDASGPAVPIAAVPLDSAPALDFPYAILTGKPRNVSQAAARFRAALVEGNYADILARRGLRTSDGIAGKGFPTGHGVSAARAEVKPLSEVEKVSGVLGVWVAAKTASRVLALVDVTRSMGGTMTGPNGNSEVRLNVLRQAAIDGLKLFTNDSQLGMWAYAAGLDGPKDYREVVPIGELDEAQRGRVTAAVNAAQPVPTDVCALFETLLDAYKTMKQGYDSKLSNTIVVFTDGKSNKPGGLDLKRVQRELETLTDVTRPIRVILLGVGPDVDMTQLEALAQTTGGHAFEVRDPAEISTIFLEALLR